MLPSIAQSRCTIVSALMPEHIKSWHPLLRLLWSVTAPSPVLFRTSSLSSLCRTYVQVVIGAKIQILKF